MGKTGTADLPLHSGSAPRWLFDRMEELGGAIAAVVIAEHGRDGLLQRLSDPHWFQAFGCVLGFDWHSSGLTTTTMGALQEALDPEDHGILVAGGKGARSRETPGDIAAVADTFDLRTAEVDRFQRGSRLGAAVDDGCVQDRHDIYHHTFVLTEDGDWAIVQQGMGEEAARRYHWLSDAVGSYVEEPQAGIAGMDPRPGTLDLTAAASGETREVAVDLVNDDPRHLERAVTGQQTLDAFTGGGQKHLAMPEHHALREADLSERSMKQLRHAYERQPADFEELVETDGVGKKSLRALALIAELVYGTESSWEDPATYAYAHGGKDGTPFPVDRDRYDESIRQVKAAVEGADVEREEKRDALRRLQEFCGG